MSYNRARRDGEPCREASMRPFRHRSIERGLYMSESKPETEEAAPAQGFERTAERDAKSHQVIGEHSPEVERKIGGKMPDRQ